MRYCMAFSTALLLSLALAVVTLSNIVATYHYNTLIKELMPPPVKEYSA